MRRYSRVSQRALRADAIGERIRSNPGQGGARRPTRLAAATSALLTCGLVLAGCSGEPEAAGPASVQFTGDGCVYSGPTGFRAGDSIDITAVDAAAERHWVGFGLNKVANGTTVADARELAEAKRFAPFGLEVAIAQIGRGGVGTALEGTRTEKGTERVLSATLDEAGTWLLHCFAFLVEPIPGGAFPGGPRDIEAIPAATFEVAE